MSRPPATTFEYLQFHAASTPDRVALIMDDGEYTYGRFADDAQRFTKALADLGIERKQIVELSEGFLRCREYNHTWYWSACWVRLAMRSEGHYSAVNILQFLSSQKSRPRSLRM